MAWALVVARWGCSVYCCCCVCAYWDRDFQIRQKQNVICENRGSRVGLSPRIGKKTPGNTKKKVQEKHLGVIWIQLLLLFPVPPRSSLHSSRIHLRRAELRPVYYKAPLRRAKLSYSDYDRPLSRKRIKTEFLRHILKCWAYCCRSMPSQVYLVKYIQGFCGWHRRLNEASWRLSYWLL